MPSVELISGKKFGAEKGEPLLDAGARANVLFNYSCRAGRCSSCKCRVVSGSTTTLKPESGLSDQEKAEGWILSCVRSAETDLVLEVDDLDGVELPKAKTFPCRIHGIERLTRDVIRVFLRLPLSTDFRFIPGQYIDVIGPGGIRRSYSLANASFSNNVLELHIRAVSSGAMSKYWFEQAKVNDLLRLNGPLGTFFLRDSPNSNLIFLATGTGIAPVKAILESIFYLEPKRRPKSVAVLWGGRTPEDLYFDVAGLPGRHHFVPVLSRAEKDWAGAKGYVQEVLLTLNLNLNNSDVYACGSDSMIHSARKTLTEAGLSPNCFHSDAFVCSGTI